MLFYQAKGSQAKVEKDSIRAAPSIPACMGILLASCWLVNRVCKTASCQDEDGGEKGKEDGVV